MTYSVAETHLVVEDEGDFLEMGHSGVDGKAGRLGCKSVTVGGYSSGGPGLALKTSVGNENLKY